MRVKIAILLAGGIVSSYGSGFKLNEQSLNGTALNSAYIAGAYGADSSYYNPANMGFDEANEIEVNGTMIFIPGFDFTTAGRDKGEISTGNGAALGPNRPAGPAIVSGRANPTLAFAPKIFFKTKPWHIGDSVKTNFGLSITTPSGLSMDWSGEGGRVFRQCGDNDDRDKSRGLSHAMGSARACCWSAYHLWLWGF